VASASNSDVCPSEETVVRVLERWAKGDTDEYLGAEELRGISLSELRTLFTLEQSADPCMFNQYLVGERQVSRLRDAVSQPIDVAAYDYFVAAYQK
jgi:hypothetical protein